MKNTLKNKSTAQLKSNLNMLKAITAALIVVMVLLISITTYGLIVKKEKSTFIALFAVAFSMLGVLPVLFTSMGAIKKKLSQREQ